MRAPPETQAQQALFDPDDAPDLPTQAGALSFLAPDTAAYAPALAGDGFGWLARVLPPPVPLLCPRCRHTMRLPAVALLWHCTRCDTGPTP